MNAYFTPEIMAEGKGCTRRRVWNWVTPTFVSGGHLVMLTLAVLIGYIDVKGP